MAMLSESVNRVSTAMLSVVCDLFDNCV